MSLIVSILALAIVFQTGAERAAPLEIRKGRSISVDGLASPGEWDDARSLQLDTTEGWNVTVRYKHDGSNLLFAFVGAGARTINAQQSFRFPELLIDAEDKKSEAWQSGQWWLHASANDCEGHGEFNVYRRDGKLVCAKEKSGWSANNWPYPEPPLIEISISFEKLGIKPNSSKPIGLAINVTDTKKVWTFWPATAKLETPATWGHALVLP